MREFLVPLFSSAILFTGCGGGSAASSSATADKEAAESPADAKPMATKGVIDPGAVTKGRHYQIAYPAGWSLAEMVPQGVDTLALSPLEENDTVRENINVVVEDLPQPMTTPEYSMAGMAGMQQMIKGFELISTSEVRLTGNVQAIETVYKSHFSEELHHVATMLAGKDQRGYVITGTAAPDSFDEYAPTFRTSIKSFEIIDTK